MKLKDIIGSLTAKFAALVLTFGLAGGAWAATITVGSSGADYTTLKAAFAAVSDGDTVQLIEDIAYSTTQAWNDKLVVNGKKVTFDLNGHNVTYTRSANPSGPMFYLQNGAELLIDGTGTIVLTPITTSHTTFSCVAMADNTGLKATLGANVTVYAECFGNVEYNTKNAETGSTFDIYGTIIGNNSSYDNILFSCPSGIKNFTVNILGGTLEIPKFSNQHINIQASTETTFTLNMSSGKIYCTQANFNAVKFNLWAAVKSTFNITGGYFGSNIPKSGTDPTRGFSLPAGYGFYPASGVDYCPYQVGVCEAKIGNVCYPSVSAAIEAATASDVVTLNVDYSDVVTIPAAKTVNFNGGSYTFSGSFTVNGTLKIVGGTYTFNPAAELLGAGCSVTDNGNGTWTVIQSVAQVGETSYTTFADALAAANTLGTATIKFLADVDISSATISIASGKNITLDLNGQNVSFYGSAQSAFQVSSGATLAFCDTSEGESGTFTHKEPSNGIVASNYGTVRVLSGTYNIVYIGMAYGNSASAVLDISGGNINSSLYVYYGSGATTISGGNICGRLYSGTVITGGVFDHDPTAYVDTETYEVAANTPSAGYWTVRVPQPVATIDDKTYDTIEAVIEDIADSTPVEITADTTIGTETIEAGSTVTTTSGTASEATTTPQGGGDPVTTTVTPKTVTIEKTGEETKTVAAYVVSQGSGESARQSVVTDVAKDETVVSTDANKTDVSDFVDVGKVLANAVADNDIDASTVTSMELSLSKTEKEGAEQGLSAALVAAIESATKAFEVHPVATITTTTTEGNTTTTDTVTYEVQNAELAADASFTFTLDFGVGNAGKAVTLTHYASDGTQKGDSWVETVGADGLVSVTLESFSYLLGTVAETSYYVTTVNGRYEVTTTAPAGTPTAYASEEDAVAAYQASAVAKIGSAYYATLQEAINAATTGDTVTLLADATLTASIGQQFNAGTITIDGAGHTLRQGQGANDGSTTLYFKGNNADMSALQVTIKDLVFDGFRNRSIMTDECVTLNVIGCTFQNSDMTAEGSNHVILGWKSAVTVENCVFKDNSVKAVINIDNTSSVSVENCLFDNNVCGGNGVVCFSSSTTSAVVKDNTFEDNIVGPANNAAVVYCSAPAEVSGNLFKNNTINVSSASDKEGVVVLGSAAGGSEITDNAFVNNTLGGTASNRATIWVNDKTATYEFDVSGNYWGDGAAPEMGTGNDVYRTGSGEMTLDTYAESYTLNADNNGVTVVIPTYTVTFDLNAVMAEPTQASYYGGMSPDSTVFTQINLSTAPTTRYAYTATVVEGQTVSKPFDANGLQVFPARRDGYIFDGWQLNGVDYDFTTPVTGDITLTAKWKAYTDSITIADAEEFLSYATMFSASISLSDVTATLTGDVNFTDTLKPWKPLNGFSGNLDGDGHKITGLNISATAKYVGLFDQLKFGTISNLTIESPTVTSTDSYVGALAGTSSIPLTNVNITGTISITGANNVGGLIGSAGNGATFVNCSVNGTSAASSTIAGNSASGRPIGGLIGDTTAGATLTGCSVSNVTVTGARKLGGLIGQIQTGTASDNAPVICTGASVSGVTLASTAATTFSEHLTLGGMVGIFYTPYGADVFSGTVSDLTMTGPANIAEGKNYVMGWVSGGTAGTVAKAEEDMTGANMTFNVTVSGTNTRTIPNDSTYAGINGGEPVVYVASITRGGVTTEYASAQEALDQVVSGDTLTLYAGDHGTLYIRQNPDISVIVDVVGKDGDGEGAPRGNDRYRAFANVTIVGASGATLNKIVVESGTNSSANLSSNPDYTNLDSLIEIDNLTISGLIFNLQANGPAIDLRQTYHFRLTGLTIDGCTVNGTESFGDSERLLYGVIASNARVSQNRPQFTAVEKKDVNYTTGLSNLVVTDCTFNNLHQVMEVRNVTNLTFTGNTVNGVRKHTIIALKDKQNPVALMGTVTIANNTIDGTSGDRVFRMDYANATVAITGNTITDYSASDADFIKISNSGNAASYTITGNTITGTTGGLCVNCDKEPGSTDLVAKIGTKYYKTLAEAIAAVPTDGTETTIQMIADSAEAANIVIAATKNVVLDLNGKTVSRTVPGPDASFITNNGTFTVKDTSANADGAVVLTASSGNYSKQTITVYNIGGTFNLESGTIRNATGTGLAYAVNNAVNWGHVSTFNMTGGTVTAPGGDADLRVYNNTAFSVSADCKNYVNITGGTLASSGLFIDTYLGGTYSENFTGANIANQIAISGGTINGLIDLKLRHAFNTSLSITGGDFTNARMWVRKYTAEWNSSLPEPTAPYVTISGGKFAFIAGKAFGLAYDCGTSSWTSYEKPYAVSGGVFNVEVPAFACAEGYIPVANTDDATKVAYPHTVGVAVAQIGATKYTTLAAAFEAAQAGDTVQLLKDVAMGEHAYADKAVGIDGNGKSITFDKSTLTPHSYNDFPIWIEAAAGDPAIAISDVTISGTGGNYTFGIQNAQSTIENVTINANGNEGLCIEGGSSTLAAVTIHNTGVNVNATKDWHNTALSLASMADVTVNGGEYTSENGYAIYLLTTGGKFTINDGTFAGKIRAGVNNGSITAEILIKGGKFDVPEFKTDGATAKIVISGGVFKTAPGAAYIAPGYEVVGNTDEATKEAYPYTVGEKPLVIETATESILDITEESIPHTSGQTVVFYESNNEGSTWKKLDGNPEIASLPDNGAAKTYTFKGVVTDTTSGAEVKTYTIENTVGILHVAESACGETTIIGVPWFALGEKITVDSIVYLGNRSAGDTITAYDADKDKYYTWTLAAGENNSLVWTTGTTIKEGEESNTGDTPEASEFELQRGQGLFLTRTDATKPIYLVGRADGTATAPTTLAKGTTVKPTWSLLAAPTAANFDLNSLAFTSETYADDTIMLPTKGAGVKMAYTYKDGKWGTLTSKTMTIGEQTYYYTVRDTEHATVPAGTGFWFLNKSDEKDVEWTSGGTN